MRASLIASRAGRANDGSEESGRAQEAGPEAARGAVRGDEHSARGRSMGVAPAPGPRARARGREPRPRRCVPGAPGADRGGDAEGGSLARGREPIPARTRRASRGEGPGAAAGRGRIERPARVAPEEPVPRGPAGFPHAGASGGVMQKAPCEHSDLGRDAWTKRLGACTECGATLSDALRERGIVPGFSPSQRAKTIRDLQGNDAALRALEAETVRLQVMALHESDSRRLARTEKRAATRAAAAENATAGRVRDLLSRLPADRIPEGGSPYPFRSIGAYQRFRSKLLAVARWHSRRGTEHLAAFEEGLGRWLPQGRPRGWAQTALAKALFTVFSDHGRAPTGPRAVRTLITCHTVVFGRPLSHERAAWVLMWESRRRRWRLRRKPDEDEYPEPWLVWRRQ